LQWNFFVFNFAPGLIRFVSNQHQRPNLATHKKDERALGHSPLIGVISIDGETYDDP
jgi:hypothetical protein